MNTIILNAVKLAKELGHTKEDTKRMLSSSFEVHPELEEYCERNNITISQVLNAL